MIIVGAPVHRREWVIEEWYKHVRRAMEVASVKDYAFAFAGNPSDPTFEYINEQPEQTWVVKTREDISERERAWNQGAYHKMVALRNGLLQVPRTFKPQFFISLDTDILIHEDCIVNLIDSTEFYDAVGGKCYMTPNGRHYPSYAMLNKYNNLIRNDANGVFQVDVIMAIKLMTPNAYNTDYVHHKHGEDIGWSIAARKRGMVLGWDGRCTNKHIVKKSMLSSVDARVGF